MAGLIIDNMEYSSPALAQAAYVTNATEVKLGRETSGTEDTWGANDNHAFGPYLLPANSSIISISFFVKNSSGSNANMTLGVYSDSSSLPGALLANSGNITVANGFNNYKTVSITPIAVTVDTYIWISMVSDQNLITYYNTVTGAGFKDPYKSYGYQSGVMPNPFGTPDVTPTNREFSGYITYISLQSYSEASIKTQGSYALKVVAAITASANKTLTHTFASSLDLSGVNTLKLDMRASRTGANIKLGLHDTGGTTTELTPTIATADTYQTFAFNLAGVADANKDAIDSLIITITNADEANTIYIDNFGIAQGFQGFWIG